MKPSLINLAPWPSWRVQDADTGAVISSIRVRSTNASIRTVNSLYKYLKKYPASDAVLVTPEGRIVNALRIVP